MCVIYSNILILIFFCHRLNGSYVGPELQAHRQFHYTYFITKEMIKKDESAYSFGGETKAMRYFQFERSSCIDKEKDNAEINIKVNPDAWYDCIKCFDGRHYGDDEVACCIHTVIINVTMDLIAQFVEKSEIAKKNKCLLELLALTRYNSPVRHLLPRKSKDYDVETFLHCFLMRTHSDQFLDLNASENLEGYCNLRNFLMHGNYDKVINWKKDIYRKKFDAIVIAAKNIYQVQLVCFSMMCLFLLGVLIFCHFNKYIDGTIILTECGLLFSLQDQYVTYIKLCKASEQLKANKAYYNNTTDLKKDYK